MSSIIGAYIEITGVCNEKCPYCYNEKLVNTGKSLPYEKIVDILHELKDQGISSVAFSGGEPFLHERLFDIMVVAEEIGMGLNVISNGTCFEDENFPLLQRFQPGLQITFDGYDEISHDVTRGKGNFKKITEGIINARKNGYRGNISIRTNLHKKNIGHMPEFLKMFESQFDVDGEDALDINTISMSLLRKVEHDSNDGFNDYLKSDEYMQYPEIFNMFSDWNTQHTVKINYDFNNPDIGCPYNASIEDVKCGLRIALDGNVFPCQSFTDNVFSLGNIHENTLQGIMSGENLAAFIEAVHARKGNIEQFRACGYKIICAGGCPAMAYIENGTLNSVSARCKTRKTHFNTVLQKLLHDAYKKG